MDFASNRRVKETDRYLQSPEAKRATAEHPVIARRRAKEEASRQPVQGASSISDKQKEILRARVEAQKAAEQPAKTAEQEKQSQLSKAAELLAARRQDPEFQAQREKAEKARARSARRAASKKPK